MKILQMFDFFSPLHGGGTVDLLYRVAGALAGRGHEVSLYTSDFELDSAYISSLNGVTVDTFHCLSSLGRFFITPGVISRSRRELNGFDIVHMHCVRSFQNAVVSHYALKYGVPYVVDAHGSLPRAVGRQNRMKTPLKWLYDVVFGNRLLRNAGGLIAENEAGRGEYESYGVSTNRVSVIHPPLDIDEFSRLPVKGLFRKKYGIGERKLVLFLGRIHWIKGLDFLVKSYALLLRERPETALAIVGPDDGYQPALEKLIGELELRERVVFTGFLGGENKLSALVDADVLVQPSVYEQGARPSLEAVLCNTPVIVSRDTGAGMDIGKMDAGYLVKHGDTEKLAGTLQSILDNPGQAQARTEKAREYIVKNLSLDVIIGKYEDLYRETIAKSGRKLTESLA